MKVIDRNACSVIRQELNAVLKQFEDKHGLKVTVGAMRFDEALVKINVEMRVQAEAGGVELDANTRFHLRMLFGHDKTKGSDIFLDPRTNRRFHITGYNARAFRMPWILSEVGAERRVKAPDGWVKGLVQKL